MRIAYLLGLLFCLLVAIGGVIVSLMGLEALTTGANVGTWVFWLLALVVLPVGGVFCCLVSLFRTSSGSGHDPSSG